jgi:signal transduction histidine kinase
MSQQKILVVEDEAIVAEDIAYRLQNLGYTVTDIVSSGEEALVSIGRIVPDLVLMDIMLQGQLDGCDTAKKIYYSHQKPIVYLTAYGDEKTLEKAKFEGSFGYILKPFHERELKVAIDISLANYQRELAKQSALEIAQNQSEQKTQYLAIASHEIRNPLTQIKAWTQLLERYSKQWSEEQHQQVFKQIYQAVERVNNLLEDLLILVKQEKETREIVPSPLDLIDFCQQILRSQQLIAGREYQFIFDCQEIFLAVNLNQILLTHILNNLLSNAVKYSPAYGQIILSLTCDNQQLCLQVSDRGIGIPTEDLDKLFIPFQRGGNVGTIPGTGLGLVIAKQATELLGGQLEVSSQVAQGTTVTVSFPLAH